MLDETLCRDADDPNCDLAVGGVGQTGFLEQLEHTRPETARHDALLEGHDQRLAPRRVEDQLAVERLGEPGIEQPDRPTFALQDVGGLAATPDDRSEANDQDLPSFTQQLAHTDRNNLWFTNRNPKTWIARVVERKRVILGERGLHQRTKR